MKSARSSWGRRLAAVVLGVAAALAGAELWLRARGGGDAFRPWPPGLRLELLPDPALLPGVEGPSRFATTSRGLRASEPTPERTLRVLAVGGSTTECLYLDQDEAWPALVQRRLNEARGARDVWVGNAARSGHDSRHHVVQLEHLLPALPDVDAVLVLAGVNDLGARLAREDAYDPRWREAPAERARLLREAFAVAPAALRPGAPWHERLALWRTARDLQYRLLPGATVQDREGRVYATWRAHRRAAAELRDELPDLGPALAEYRGNVAELVRLARACGVAVAFLTQPVLWRADLPRAARDLLWLGGVGDFQRVPGQPYYTPRALAEGMAAYDRALREVCAELGVPCLDLAAAIPASTAAFYDDCHFHEAGARLVADAVAPFLLDVLAGLDPQRASR